MAVDPIGIADAMADEGARQQIEHMVMLMRVALAPIFNGDVDNIPQNQSYAITAAALFAGMTAGHMIVLDAMKEQDKRRAGATLLANFRSGIEMGKSEVRKAMLEQMPAGGTA